MVREYLSEVRDGAKLVEVAGPQFEEIYSTQAQEKPQEVNPSITKAPQVELPGKYPELASITEEQLLELMEMNKAKGISEFEETRKAFEELIARNTTPEFVRALKEELLLGLKKLRDDQDDNGETLSQTQRIDCHLNNLALILKLQEPVKLELEYAQYLGSKDILGAKIPTTDNPQAIQTAKNQEKPASNASMDSWTREAIKSADALPISLMKQESSSLWADKQKNLPDPSQVIEHGLAYLEGEGDFTGALDSAVTLRVQLAKLYLHQGLLTDADGNEPRLNAKAKPDELFKPQEALKLLEEAQSKNQEINKEERNTRAIETLLQAAKTAAPERMQALAMVEEEKIRSSDANTWATMASMSLQYLTELALTLLTRGRLKPTVVQSIASLVNFGGTTYTRSELMRNTNGESESWGDTLTNSMAITTGVLGTRYLGGVMLNRATTGEASGIATAILDKLRLPSNTKMEEVIELLAKNKIIKDPSKLQEFTGKTLSEVKEEVGLWRDLMTKAPELKGADGLQALTKLEKQASQLDVVGALETKGVRTIGTLESRLGNNLVLLRRFLADSKEAGINLKNTSVEEAITKLHDAKIGSYGRVSIEQQTAMFKELGLKLERLDSQSEHRTIQLAQRLTPNRSVKTMADLESYLGKATANGELKRLFPDLAELPGTKKLADYVREGGQLAKQKGSAVILERLAPGSGTAKTSTGIGMGLKELIFENRFYRSAFPGARNIQSMSHRQLESYIGSRSELAAIQASFLSISALKNGSIIYEDWLKVSPDAEGLSFSQALLKANFGSASASFDTPVNFGTALLNSNLMTSLYIGAPLKGPIVGIKNTGQGWGSLKEKTFSLLGNGFSFLNTGSIWTNGDAQGLYSNYQRFYEASHQPLENYSTATELGLALP